MTQNTNEHVTIRFARPDDATRIARLARLDSARPPQGRLLVAEVAGELRAALPLDGGAAGGPLPANARPRLAAGAPPAPDLSSSRALGPEPFGLQGGHAPRRPRAAFPSPLRARFGADLVTRPPQDVAPGTVVNVSIE